MNRYLKLLFRYLFSNLTRQVVAISSNSYFPYYFSLILLSRAICVVRWHVRMLATYVSQLSFLFAYDPLNRPKSYETSVRSKVLTFTGSCYFLFLLLFTGLVYRNTDKIVWSHLYDLVVRNREQVSFCWWRSSGEWSNRRDSRSISYQKISTWLNRLKTFPFYTQLKVLQSAKLLHYPKLAERLRLRAVRICFVFELLMVAIYFYYLNILYFDLVGQLRKLGKPMTIAQLITTALAYLSIMHTAFYTYAGLLLVELVLYLVCTVYAGQYQNLNRDLEKLKISMLKNANDSSFQSLSSKDFFLQNLNRSTAVYRSVHTRLTVFILRFNGSLVSKVIAYYLHYYLPYHSYRLVYIYFQQRSLPLAIAINSYWFLLFMWLFLMIITLGVARTNSEIGRSGRALSALFARKGLLSLKIGSFQRRQSYYYSAKESEASGTIGHREALKLSTYFEMIWREEKQLAFTAGQTDTAMNWRFIFEVKTDFS